MNLTDLMGKAREMKARMEEMKERLAFMEAEGAAGGGLVRCKLNGKGVLLSLSIDESLIKADEREILEDLILAAHNDARKNLDALADGEMQKVTSSLGLPPGFNLPF